MSRSSPGKARSGLEILEDCPDVDLVLVPVGGGGLISGVSAALQAERLEGEGDRRRA